ncbi:hypothetical protein [Duganella vulcania]|uniref:Uncharacterized protein n=1 Tax=Duganella vulcania TaxID=2692166 RepID=A0A845GM29_9BURK|nr:hypothetical protein [Duganella vulcania]MYM94455.1 hypothetical protein [Duganella vulcania]
MQKTILLILLLLTQLVGCWQTVVFDEKITGPYRLSAIDITEEMSVCYELKEEDTCIGRIPEMVFSVGWNENFIVAKQHPSGNKAVTNYFILDRKKDAKYVDPSVTVKGPLSELEYKEKSNLMSLPEFTRTFDDLR